jgi:hypothetical protein
MSEQLTEEQLMSQIATSAPVEKKVDEMGVLFQEPKTFTLNGEQVTVKPFKFGHLPQVLKLLRSVGGLFAHYQSQGKLNSMEAIIHIVGEAGDDLINALALNTGKPREFWDEIDSDEGLEVMIHFLIVNIGFFTKRVMPHLQQAMKA